MKNPIRCFEGKAEPHEAFWKIRSQNETGGDPELEFYGVISEFSWLDDEISPRKFKDELTRIGQGKPITVRIDSPGGDPIAASTISAIISSYPGKVTAQIDGQASSAAVMVALAASHIRIMGSAYMMIHDPKVSVLFATLDAETLSRLATALASIKQGMMQSYAARTGQPETKLAQMMTDTTWMSAQEAVDLHFADEIVTSGQKRTARKFENVLRNFEHVPSALLNAAEESIEEPSEAGETPTAEPVIDPEQVEEHQAAPDGAEDEPAVDPLADLKLALQSKLVMQSKGATMFVRELLKQRDALVVEANALINQADTEKRDLTAEERARFTAILGEGETAGEVGALDIQIKQIEAEREALRAAAETKFSSQTPEKPAPSVKMSSITRAEFDQLSASERAAFVKAGGKIQD